MLEITSFLQEFNQKKSIFNASGNVRIWYQDYYAAGPKVTLLPSAGSNKPNEAYFSGRSSITQCVRTIYADRIIMVINPKSFDAQGNTRTVIRNIGSGSDDSVTLGL